MKSLEHTWWRDGDEDGLSVEVEENGENDQEESEKNQIDACSDEACSALLFVIDLRQAMRISKKIEVQQMTVNWKLSIHDQIASFPGVKV